MKVTDERIITIELGDRRRGDAGDYVRVRFECAPNGVPESFEIMDPEGVYRDGLLAEMVERIAAAVRCLRERVGDLRGVCPDHGYYYGVGREPVPEGFTAGCPRCQHEAKAAEAAKVLREAPQEST